MRNVSPVQFKEYLLKFNPAPDDADMENHRIIAQHKGRKVGEMQVDIGTSQIQNIEVHPRHQRKGVATAMWNYAQDISGNNIHHSPVRTDEGDAWAKTVGGAGLETRTCSSCGDEGHLASEHQ
jgi:hypothetical protein